jgi:PAS domain S-box-containing protein
VPAAPEDREREAARRRGEARERERAAGREPARDPYSGQAAVGVASGAFASLADNVRDYAIFLMDTDGIITFWGEGARLLKGWTKDQAEGAHLRLLYRPGGSEDGTADLHLRLAAESGEYCGEGQRVKADGSTSWFGVSLTALRDERGLLLGFAKTTRDLTARRAAEAQQKSATAAAEETSRAKSEFLATMSHEIRTPVNGILGYLDLLGMEVESSLTAAQRDYLTRASVSGRHLLAVISDVLDFSRIEAGRTKMQQTRVRLAEVVAAALDLVVPDARARGVELADGVRSSQETALDGWGDGTCVRQILLNLLTNAIKFTVSGEAGPITVSAGTATSPPPEGRVSGDGPWVYVCVQDAGPGIPADRLQALFEPFVQGDSSLTRPHGGVGLGLAISRRLARLMGGDLTARCEAGVGSAFFLWLPAAPA